MTGDELLEILVELAQEGRMVVWREGDTCGFLSAKTWQQEMAAIETLAMRAECEAMRLENEDIAYLRDTIMGIIAGILVSSSSGSPKNTRCSAIKI